jgi:hypothetical protein
MMLAGAAAARGTTQADATVATTSPGAVDAYDHTVTLTNTGDTPISTFWYSWSDYDLNFLVSPPDNIRMPAGWVAAVTACSTGYFQSSYGIEWYTTTNPILAGEATSAFGFESNDSAVDLEGFSSNNYYGLDFPIGTSFVYASAPDFDGGIPSGAGFAFVAGTAPVPEPATLGILWLALAIPLTRRGRRGLFGNN